MTPEQRTAARHRLQKRIGMPYTRSIAYTKSGEAKLVQSFINAMLYGIPSTPAFEPDDTRPVTLPSFQDFAERHR